MYMCVCIYIYNFLFLRKPLFILYMYTCIKIILKQINAANVLLKNRLPSVDFRCKVSKENDFVSFTSSCIFNTLLFIDLDFRVKIKRIFIWMWVCGF